MSHRTSHHMKRHINYITSHYIAPYSDESNYFFAHCRHYATYLAANIFNRVINMIVRLTGTICIIYIDRIPVKLPLTKTRKLGFSDITLCSYQYSFQFIVQLNFNSNKFHAGSRHMHACIPYAYFLIIAL